MRKRRSKRPPLFLYIFIYIFYVNFIPGIRIIRYLIDDFISLPN